MTKTNLHDTTDASEWAKQFRETAIKLGYSDMDEGWLIAWFANAMMAQSDAEARARIMRGDPATKEEQE